MKKKAHSLALESFAALVRRKLLEAGYSPDAHVENLEAPYLESRATSKAASFLVELRSLLFALCPLDRLFLVMEGVERGRHYPFWYYPFMGEVEYRKMEKWAHLVLEGFLERHYAA